MNHLTQSNLITDPYQKPVISEVLSDGITYDPGGVNLPRSFGIHQSSVINDFWYRRVKKYDEQDISEASPILEAGFAWEELLENAWSTRQGNRLKVLHDIVRPGEQKFDWAYMTPDGWDPVLRVLHEYKLTTKSASKLLDFENEFFNFILQAAGYCLAMGTKSAVFWIMFIGRSQLNKEDSWKPARVYRVDKKFTSEELLRHWRTLTNHKDWMINKGLLKAA